MRAGIVAALFLPLYACFSSGEDSSPDEDSGPGQVGVSAALPAGVTVLSNQSLLSAVLVCPNEDRVPMVIGASNVTGACPNVEVGSNRSFRIVFSYEVLGDPPEVAIAERTIDVVSGANPALVVQESDYDYPDDDEDGETNLEELAGEGWGAARLIEADDAEDAEHPRIAVDASGNALAVWRQYDGTRYNLWSNRYTLGSGWGTAQLIEDNAGNASIPQLAIDGLGNALAVWQQRELPDDGEPDDVTRYNLWSNRYTAGVGWGAARLVGADNGGNVLNPRIAFDASDNALAVWTQWDGTSYKLWSNRYTAGSDWGTAQSIETDSAGNVLNPRIAFDATGNALAVWEQSDGTRRNLWSNRYTAGSDWGTAQSIETDNAGDVFNPRIVVDAAGNALAVWEQSDGTRRNLWSNRYTAGSGWGTAQLIETDDTSSAINPQIAMDASGNAMAVWQQDGTHDKLWSNRYTAGSGWETAQLIGADKAGDAWNPLIAVDGLGNVLAVWQQWDGTNSSVWSNLYAAGSGWGKAHSIGADSAGNAWSPQLAFDATGNALAVWYQYDDTRSSIWANRFVMVTR